MLSLGVCWGRCLDERQFYASVIDIRVENVLKKVAISTLFFVSFSVMTELEITRHHVRGTQDGDYLGFGD